MSELHPLGISHKHAQIEAVSPEFLREAQLKAQKKSWEALGQVFSQLQVGMSENDARLMAIETFKKLGVAKHWHRPYIRFGPGTQLTFNDPIQPEYRLQKNDPVYLDLGPVWSASTLGVEGTLEYEGDVGDSFVFGTNADATKCIQTARDLFGETKKLWLGSQNSTQPNKKLSGKDLYAFLKNRALELGYDLVEHVDGHRMSDFPHQKYTKEKLSEFTYHPTDALWILEVMIKHPTLPLGAFHEDLLLK